MTKPITIIGPLPPSTNNIYKNFGGRGRALTDEAKAYKNKLIYALKRGGIKSGDVKPPFLLVLRVYMSDQRRADAPNRLKLIEDVLMKHLGYDDTLVYDHYIRKFVDRRSPRVELELHHTDRELEVG